MVKEYKRLQQELGGTTLGQEGYGGEFLGTEGTPDDDRSSLAASVIEYVEKASHTDTRVSELEARLAAFEMGAKGNNNSSTAQSHCRQCTICQNIVTWPNTNHHHLRTYNLPERNKNGQGTSHRSNRCPTNSTPHNKEDGQTTGANHAREEPRQTTRRTHTQLSDI